MINSGIRDALELFYDENTVLHLLSGKAVDRAIGVIKWQILHYIHYVLLEDIIGSTDIDSDSIRQLLH